MTTIYDFPTETLLHVFMYLAAAWPAGRFNDITKRSGLGWVNATHVCRHWRGILLRFGGIWSLWATSFHNINAFNTFLLRSGATAPWIDLDLLYANAGPRRITQDMLNTILATEVLSRAQGLVSSKRYQTQWPLSRHLQVALRTVVFYNVQRVDIYISSSTPLNGEMNAPQLHALSIRSDAAHGSHCPVSVGFLVYIFKNSTRLQELRIRRCINTTTMTQFDDNEVRLPRPLAVIDVSCHSEQFLPVLHAFFNLKSSNTVTIELYAPRDLRDALTSAIDHVGLQRNAAQALDIRYEREQVFQRSHSIRDTFFVLCIVFPTGYTIKLRMGDRSTNWSWKMFVDDFPCAEIRDLSLTNNSDFDNSPDHYRPYDLITALSGLHTLTVADRPHIELLRSVPRVAPVDVLTVDVHGGTNLADLAEVWHWLRKRGTKPSSMMLCLTGRLCGLGPDEEYCYLEGPTMAALSLYATIIDYRVTSNGGFPGQYQF
ncbi:unnamed protein product [Peniophora sp. CBMAI 1063]|nr:unnamed protein product [Peniophora sp. CBMAI 1063]